MDVTFLYLEDCPSHEEALGRLRQVMREEKIEAQIKIVRVETEEQAQKMQFTGSPTIRINGKDIVKPPAEPRYGLACRAYQLEDGRISPLPSLRMIRSAIAAARREAI
jgi:hypothetical protein